ncbi:MAG: hypothetical protein KAJ19_12220 [Gammaproteobacteria bacterium]|nr:hypothetical protein [Gammaproteobacteria bacterium]
MRIARCTPSRGLVHSRTEEAAEIARSWAVRQGHHWRSFYSHDLGIPDCFNYVCHDARAWGADLIWMLEEDVCPVPVAFPLMVGAITSRSADVAVVDYVMDAPDDGQISWGITRDGAGRIAWARTGCILFKRECLDALLQPWFTLTGRMVRPGSLTWESGPNSSYGADVGFTHCLVQLGFEFVEIEAKCDHLRVVERGQSGVNQGWHEIEPLPTPPKPPDTPPRRSQNNGSIAR